MSAVDTPCGAPFDLSWLPGALPRRIESGPDSLFALELGQGPAVLLLHGYSCELTHFRYQLLALAEAGLRAIALDLPGHGHSSRPRGEVPAERFIAGALAALDQLGVERAHLVGHSMGGAVALALAARFPARVDRVALLAPCTPGLPLGPSFGLWMERIAPLPLLPRLLLALQGREAFERSLAEAVVDLAPVLAEDGGRWRDYPWAMQNVPGTRRALVGVARPFLRSWASALPALPQLGERGLLVWGREDRVVPFAGAEAVQAATGARRVDLDATGHCAHFEQPERVNAELRAHFGSFVALRTQAD
jgi:pyruvate dehydrogenase E2 component (dihydrolipoamide acetyltransferase)